MVTFPFPLPETQGNVTFSFLSSFLPFFSFSFLLFFFFFFGLFTCRNSRREIHKRLQLPEISHTPDIHAQSPAIHPHSQLQAPGADGPRKPIKLWPASPVCIRSHLVVCPVLAAAYRFSSGLKRHPCEDTARRAVSRHDNRWFTCHYYCKNEVDILRALHPVLLVPEVSPQNVSKVKGQGEEDGVRQQEQVEGEQRIPWLRRMQWWHPTVFIPGADPSGTLTLGPAL